MTLADLTDGKKARKASWRARSVTSGARSPTKIEWSAGGFPFSVFRFFSFFRGGFFGPFFFYVSRRGAIPREGGGGGEASAAEGGQKRHGREEGRRRGGGGAVAASPPQPPRARGRRGETTRRARDRACGVVGSAPIERSRLPSSLLPVSSNPSRQLVEAIDPDPRERDPERERRDRREGESLKRRFSRSEQDRREKAASSMLFLPSSAAAHRKNETRPTAPLSRLRSGLKSAPGQTLTSSKRSPSAALDQAARKRGKY